MNETFGIVIPVFNRRKVVERTLQSVRQQTYRPLHLILVDNNSTDGSYEFLKEWADKNKDRELQITVTRELKPGAAAARNKGLELIDTRRMLFFDSDDLLMPHAVEAFMAAFTGEEKPELVMSRARQTGTGSGKSFLLPLRSGSRMDAHIHHGTLRTVGYAASTELFRKAGGWNENLRIWDDWELGVRLLLATQKIAQISDVVCEIFVGNESITGARYSDRAELYEAPIQAVEQVLKKSGLADAPRICALMNYRRIMLAAHFAREGETKLAEEWKDCVHKKISSYSYRRKALLKLAYWYIRHGGRGFDRIISLLY
ncbi:MAG: glycosyltransferase family 2 protein [Prevotella sp.]|nr:glycosyltransferase family 2 protein [Prevotella sp.]MCM1075412.1 glycosyltransferase family 2 protein [Ruminococcus sp.]